jgi:DNA polymerase I-like protein with 3'-5' exonuclease and polymerase domains
MLREPGSSILLLLEVPIGRVKRTVHLVREVMEVQPPDFSVPLKVDIHVGRSWADCKGGSAKIN